MKKVLKKINYLLLIPVIITAILLYPVQSSNAASLSAAYIMFSRIQANLTAIDNLELYIAFETTNEIGPGSTITLEFPDAEDGNWCRTAGTGLTISGVTFTPADSTGAYDIDAALPTPTTLAASCTQGAGDSSSDTITITQIDTLLAGNTYGVKISNGATPKLGTGTADTHPLTLTVTETEVEGGLIETMTLSINTVSSDQVTINAEVASVETVTCTLSTNSVGLGTLYKGGSYVTGTHTITTSTSDSAGGYFWSVYGLGNGTSAGLWKSDSPQHLIESVNTANTMNLTVSGSEGFGLNTTEPSTSVAGAGFSQNSNGNGVYGSIGSGAANAELLLYKLSPASVSPDEATITYGARAGNGAEAGMYSETVTFVCGGYY